MSSQAKLILVIIVVLVAFVWVNYSWLITGHVIPFIEKHYPALLAPLVGGVLASLLGSVILYILLDRKTVKTVHRRLEGIEKAVSSLQKEYIHLIEGLPDAIGGRFTESLFQFPPSTSRRIATILSQEVARLYTRHYDRIVVTHAHDSYYLKELMEFDTQWLVWKLAFHSEWTWKNDSQIARKPLSDFKILVTAPDAAVDSFISEGMGLKERDKARDELKVFKEKSNFVRSTVVNPKAQKDRLLNSEIDKLFGINEVLVTAKGGKPTRVTKSELILLDLISGNLPSVGIYLAFQLPTEASQVTLETDEELTIAYSGWLTVPTSSLDNKLWGWIGYPPSDLIETQYIFDIVYPNKMSANGKSTLVSVAPDPQKSGCFFIPEDRQIGERTDNYDHIPVAARGRYTPKEGESVWQLRVRGPLMDNHSIELEWNCTSIP